MIVLPPHQNVWLGLMSGTSTDGVDVAALLFTGESFECLGLYSEAFPPDLRERLLRWQNVSLALSLDADPIAWSERVSNELTRHYAAVAQAAIKALALDPNAIAGAGAHGQTVRHRPDQGFTLQQFNPALFAELTGLLTVSDFRRRDVAAAGQGAPLVPAFHRAWMQSKGIQKAVVLNVGGFSNVTCIDGDSLIGTDCGPANVLLDAWIHQHHGHLFDEAGRWASTGAVNQALLADCLGHPFFSKSLPASTGRDDFHLAWLAHTLLVGGHEHISAVDVQATLLALSVESVRRALQALGVLQQRDLPLIVCGGGAANTYLLSELQTALPRFKVQTARALDLHPQAVEACAFAWMARNTCLSRPSNACSVTGAAGPRILGSLTPA